MNFAYDSWNRIQSMTYPDGEVVSYSYNRGGMLDSIGGRKGSYSCSYINHIAYNEYELKDSVLYGNGSFAAYEYDVLMRLQRLQSYTGGSPAEKMQDITYTYDAVSNITSISNSANVLSNGLGGKYSNMYRYDNLYRLSYSQGDWLGSPNTNYELEMSYLSNGRISRKTLSAGIVTQTPSSNSFSTDIYDNVYHYNNPLQPNTLTHIDNSSQQILKWDNAGNMTYHRMSEECVRNLCWDEENRLQGVTDCNFTSYYQYDAGGERTYKLTGKTQTQNINGHSYMYAVLDNPTLYASPYLVATQQGYTKHYYADNERIASKIGSGGIRDIALLEDVEVFNNKQEANNQHIGLVKDCVGGLELQIPDKQLHILYKLKQNLEPEKEVYYYHPDHLGSSSWITHTDGSAIQHLHYLPYGEDFVNQKTTSFSSIYTFSAKEKDAETGYSYFGARYYNSALSIWLSVDPMAGKYPSMSPYVYCAGNPVRCVDLEGKEIGDFFDENGTFLMNDGFDDGNIYIVNSEEWNCIWDDDENFPKEIRETSDLFRLSCSAKKPSSSNLSDDAIYNILNHYNTTGLPLNIFNGDNSALFTTVTKEMPNDCKSTFSHTLYANIQNWRNNSYFLNNSYDILSSYDNELGHITSASSSYMNLSKDAREITAINYQRMQNNFSKTSYPYQVNIGNYYQKCLQNLK